MGGDKGIHTFSLENQFKSEDKNTIRVDLTCNSLFVSHYTTEIPYLSNGFGKNQLVLISQHMIIFFFLVERQKLNRKAYNKWTNLGVQKRS